MDDEESQRTALAGMIALWGYAVETAADGEEALEKLQSFGAHVLVTDLKMPRMDGMELLQRLRAAGGGPASIVLTAHGSLEAAVSIIHDLGAFWFLEKPVQSAALRLLLERAVQQGRLAEHAERLERQLSNRGLLGEMVGASRKMREVFSLIQQVAPSRAAVLITGESGTGKELAARAIHALSTRRTGAVLRHQLRGHAGHADGKRAVRPREGRVHGGRGTPRRLFRAGAERHRFAG